MQLFFSLLSLVLIGVKVKSDSRAKFLMSGSPAIKFGLWLIFNALPFFLPNSVILSYGYLARVGSTLFLIIQLFLLLDFVLTMNEKWVAAAEDDERNYKGMLALTVGCYVGCLVLVGACHLQLLCGRLPRGMTWQTPAGCAVQLSECRKSATCTSCAAQSWCSDISKGGSAAGMLFRWFKPSGAGSCSFNVGVIVATIFLFIAFTVVSISPLVPSGSLFPSGVISLYVVYLAYGALQSEPHTEQCNGLGHKIDAASGSTLAVGMLLMLLSVVYSAFKCAFLQMLPMFLPTCAQLCFLHVCTLRIWQRACDGSMCVHE